jgi:phytoene synthase
MPRNTSFYYSFLVLPAAQRRAIIAVWDFCRAVDDAVDEMPAGDVGFWREELGRCYGEATLQTPQGRALQPFIREFDLPRGPFADVIDGVEMDLVHNRYETFDDLFEYCRRVASAVGLICIRIFGCTSTAAADYALNLGVALQLTNILRDISSDLERGRIYLPLADLRACGCSIDDLAAATDSEPVRRLVAFECRRAREYYDRAVAVRPEADRRRLVAAEIMRAVYFETLRRIERNGYGVFSTRARVPRPQQALIAIRQWLFA